MFTAPNAHTLHIIIMLKLQQQQQQPNHLLVTILNAEAEDFCCHQSPPFHERHFEKEMKHTETKTETDTDRQTDRHTHSFVRQTEHLTDSTKTNLRIKPVCDFQPTLRRAERDRRGKSGCC